MPYKDPEAQREYKARWYQHNKDKHNAASRAWYRDNASQHNANSARYYAEHKKEISQYKRGWQTVNQHKHRAACARYAERMKDDANYQLGMRMGARMRMALTRGKAGRHWESLVGYTLSDLKEHLERMFQPKMSWENFGEWHIDHRLPVCSFDQSDPEQFSDCSGIG